jgi:hypothetical protein
LAGGARVSPFYHHRYFPDFCTFAQCAFIFASNFLSRRIALNLMADAKEADDRLFGEKALTAVESNDLISLRSMLDERLAEDPNAFR